ncbi:MAG TPA: alpha/beta hydrolase-fold protein [Candidatus Krumholzibacterium sp.]|nr:alpha/beta hydrolase-fold protein [Candidatus Krumholzibacterium sp.]
MAQRIRNIVMSLSGISVVFIMLLALDACAQPGSVLAMKEGDPVSIGTIRKIRSEVLGEERTMLVWLPRDYEGTRLRFPVLYLLYGDQVEGYFAETVHQVSRLGTNGTIPQLIVVGIANVERYRDLRPDGQRGNPSGIGPFTEFLGSELFPFIESEYRTKDFRILVGPQAGGVFGLYELTGGTGLFDAYILENPFYSKSCSGLLMERSGEYFAGAPDRYSFLHIKCVTGSPHRDTSEAASAVRRFEEMVSSLQPAGLDLHINYTYDGDFIPSPDQKAGLEELFADFTLPGDKQVERLEDFTSHYDSLSARLGFEIGYPEIPLVSKADLLKRSGRVDEAAEMFEFVLEQNPLSLNGYWQLANIRRERGDTEGAIEYYRKCLELMPNMAPAREWLERLEER